MWCCTHADCGGVTQQNGRFEVRAGNAPTKDDSPSLVASWPIAVPRLNSSAVLECALAAELDFTLNRKRTTYASEATPERTLAISSELLTKYALYFV